MMDLFKTKEIINRYLKLFEARELKKEERALIEKKLDITLSDDFILISKYFNGDQRLGYMSLFSFDPFLDGWNIVDQTLELRKNINFPKNFLFLEQEGESFVTMLTKDDRSEPTPVYWCGSSDIYNLMEGKPLEDSVMTFPSFTDFFEYLVTEEENKRAEEKELGGA